MIKFFLVYFPNKPPNIPPSPPPDFLLPPKSIPATSSTTLPSPSASKICSKKFCSLLALLPPSKPPNNPVKSPEFAMF